MDSLRILLADDHPMYLEAVHMRLERQFPGAYIVDVGSLSDALTAARMPSDRFPAFDLILLDYHMPGVDGPAGIARFIPEVGTIPVAIMSGSATLESAQALIRAGARGFIPKTLSAAQFAAAVNALLSGATYLPIELLDGLIGGRDAGPSAAAAPAAENAPLDALLASLKPRELDVLKRLAAGRSNKEIGLEMGLAEVTVKLHVRQILKRIGLRNRVEAAALAARVGLPGAESRGPRPTGDHG